MTTIHPLDPNDGHLVGQLLRIYQASIEPSERKPTEQLTALVSDPRYRVLVSLDGSQVSGFAMCFVPGRRQFVLLEYMAVDETARSTGLGAALLEAASDIAARMDVPLVLEVDQPGSPAMPGNDPARRLRFYAQRHCYRLAGLDYILPLATCGTPPAMWLLVRGRRQALSRSEMRDWLTALYVEVYGQDESDPRIEAMLPPDGPRDFIPSPIHRD